VGTWNFPESKLRKQAAGLPGGSAGPEIQQESPSTRDADVLKKQGEVQTQPVITDLRCHPRVSCSPVQGHIQGCRVHSEG
jgi:hypothetical protein